MTRNQYSPGGRGGHVPCSKVAVELHFNSGMNCRWKQRKACHI